MPCRPRWASYFIEDIDKLPSLASVCAVGLLCSVASARAQRFQLNPIADAFVDSADPDDNFGAAGALSVAAEESASGEFDTFMEFDLSSLNSSLLLGARVETVNLQLTSANPLNPIFNPTVAGNFSIEWIVNNSWIEGSGNPNSPDTDPADINFTNHTNYLTPGTDESLGTFDFGGSTTGQNSYTLTLASGFTAAVNSGEEVSLYFSAADSSVSYLFNSRNFPTPSSEPLLTITLVPEPGMLAFLAGGLLPMAAGRPRNPSTTRC